jgi:hypothetical protein
LLSSRVQCHSATGVQRRRFLKSVGGVDVVGGGGREEHTRSYTGGCTGRMSKQLQDVHVARSCMYKPGVRGKHQMSGLGTAAEQLLAHLVTHSLEHA